MKYLVYEDPKNKQGIVIGEWDTQAAFYAMPAMRMVMIWSDAPSAGAGLEFALDRGLNVKLTDGTRVIPAKGDGVAYNQKFFSIISAN